jgi:F0F1-type ATP synthase assembly protein I
MSDEQDESRNPEPQKHESQENPWRQYGRYSHLALALPASAVVGLVMGAALDHWLHKSWLTLAGLLLGCVAGFTELIRGVLKANKET